MASSARQVIMDKLILDSDVAIRNKGVKDRLDVIGAMFNELQVAWNANITGTKLVVPALAVKYVPTSFE